MATKRRAGFAEEAGGKKVKEEPETSKVKDAAGPQVKRKRKVDEHCELSSSGEVYKDYDCMLNQTNNNKFYVIQVIKANQKYYSWKRWGRVGKVGRSKLDEFNEPETAVKNFEKKFKDKTKNNWSDRENFVSHPAKYTLIEVEVTEDVLPGTLDAATKNLFLLIFSNDMFKEMMECMNLDIKKMPLGQLSKEQIAKGFDVLKEIEAAINVKSKRLEELSSKFFTTIPHNFGRNRPPIIDNSEIVMKKKEMLTVLSDIVLAQTLKSETEAQAQDAVDQYYNSLRCRLTLMDRDNDRNIFEIIETYFNATSGGAYIPNIINIWKVDREEERHRFSANDTPGNHRLLWHGTNIAVVAAILKSGLRIMPHSGGRVGRGIYFASESSLSVKYVRPSKNNTGVMFLGEVALGNEYTITEDDRRLKKAPAGYDSVVARGRVEPDPSEDIFITLEGRVVAVPQGEPIEQPHFSGSHFSNSEYVIYKESQCRLRYVLTLGIPPESKFSFATGC